ncbi:MAG: hypothetical protein WBF84_14470 [Castellaniella sp.]|uniref:hypothetical protein n=1 Tax=Castellaniella sp. TaxID=1955812 RepID=UPI003C72FFC2
MRRLLAAVFVLMLGGCAQYQWVKPGATQQEQDRDNYACLGEATKLYPPKQVPRIARTAYTTPKKTSCETVGKKLECVTTGGDYVPEQIEYVDGNADGRNHMVKQCMGMKGWRWELVEPKKFYEPKQPPETKPLSESKKPR